MLAGTLDTFTVGEILQLLGSSGTTGALHIWTHDDEGTVYCRNGEVTAATVGSSADIGGVLVRSGFVREEEWHEVLTDPKPAERLSVALDRSGVDSTRVHRFLATQTEESVFELDAWQAGELRFEPEADHTLGGFFRYPTRQLLASLDNRRAVWDSLLARVGSVDRIVHQAPFGVDDEEMSVSRTQLMVVSHIDGRRSIRELSRFLGTGLFQTAKIVASLVDARLVVLRDDRAEGTPRAAAPVAPSPAAPTVQPPVDPAPETTPTGATEFVEPGDGPARDLIVRLLSAVKEEL